LPHGPKGRQGLITPVNRRCRSEKTAAPGHRISFGEAQLSLEWIERVHAACGADSTINWRGTLEVRERKFLSVTSVMKRPTHVPVQSFFLTAITCLRGRFE